MSKQLAISATLSILAMSVFLLFGSDRAPDGLQLSVEMPSLRVPAPSFDASELLRR